jgi:hypothetical protein
MKLNMTVVYSQVNKWVSEVLDLKAVIICTSLCALFSFFIHHK